MQIIKARDLKGWVDFGIITIRDDEFRAILQRFPQHYHAEGERNYVISRIETLDLDQYIVAIVRCLEHGPGVAQDTARDLISDFDPHWLVLVGIGGAVPADEFTLGDVVVASRLHDFCVGAALDERPLEYSVAGGPMQKEVQDLLSLLPAMGEKLHGWNEEVSIGIQRPPVKLKQNQFYGSEEWQNEVKTKLKKHFLPSVKSRPPLYTTGPVASSGLLIKDPETVKAWRKLARHIYAVEMELAGVYQAARRKSREYPILAIRGISDVVGFLRNPDWTTYACHSAASFTSALIKAMRQKPRREIPGFAPLEVALKRNHPTPGGPVFARSPRPEWQDLEEGAFCFRHDQLDTVERKLQQHRLAWVTGGHGSGKTSLALALGYTLMTRESSGALAQRSKAMQFRVLFGDIRELADERQRLARLLPVVDDSYTLFIVDSIEHEHDLAASLASSVLASSSKSYWLFCGRRSFTRWPAPFQTMTRIPLEGSQQTVREVVEAFANFNNIRLPEQNDVRALYSHCGPDLLSVVLYLKAWQRKRSDVDLASFLQTPEQDLLEEIFSASPLPRIRQRFSYEILLSFLRLCALSSIDIGGDAQLFSDLDVLMPLGDISEQVIRKKLYFRVGHPSFARHLIELAAQSGYLTLDRGRSTNDYVMDVLSNYVAGIPKNLGSVLSLVQTQWEEKLAKSFVEKSRTRAAIKAFLPNADLVELSKTLRSMRLIEDPIKALGGVEEIERLLNAENLAIQLSHDVSPTNYFVLTTIAGLSLNLGMKIAKSLDLRRLLSSGPSVTLSNVRTLSRSIKKLAPNRIDEFYDLLNPNELYILTEDVHPVHLKLLLHDLQTRGHTRKSSEIVNRIDISSLAAKTKEKVQPSLCKQLEKLDRREGTQFAAKFRSACN
jgi:nucleoside phosphorylase